MKTKSRGWVNANVYTAIGYVVDPVTGSNFVKYRNIGKHEKNRERFEVFLKKKFPGLQYVNYYDPITQKFEFRSKTSS